MERQISFTVLLLALVLVVLWAPWLTPQRAERRVLDEFDAAWQRVKDGCGFNCRGCLRPAAFGRGCGVTQLLRVPAGYAVDIEYACGLLPQDSAEFHESRLVYVSAVGTVHGLPKP